MKILSQYQYIYKLNLTFLFMSGGMRKGWATSALLRDNSPASAQGLFSLPRMKPNLVMYKTSI